MKNEFDKDQMSRAEFEERIKRRFGESGFVGKLIKKPHRKTVYYVEGKHVGTWKSGKSLLRKETLCRVF